MRKGQPRNTLELPLMEYAESGQIPVIHTLRGGAGDVAERSPSTIAALIRIDEAFGFLLGPAVGSGGLLQDIVHLLLGVGHHKRSQRGNRKSRNHSCVIAFVVLPR